MKNKFKNNNIDNKANYGFNLLLKALIAPNLSEDVVNFIKEEMICLSETPIKKNITYGVLLNQLTKSTDREEIEATKSAMQSIRTKEQNLTKNVLSFFAKEIKKKNIVNELESIKIGIEEQPDLKCLTLALNNKTLDPLIAEFIKSEIDHIKQSPMAADPNYRMALEVLIDDFDPETFEFFKETMIALREEAQKKVKIFHEALPTQKPASLSP